MPSHRHAPRKARKNARKNARIDAFVLRALRLNPEPLEETPMRYRAPKRNPQRNYADDAPEWLRKRAAIAEHQTAAEHARQRSRYNFDAYREAQYHEAEAARLEAELEASKHTRRNPRRRNPDARQISRMRQLADALDSIAVAHAREFDEGELEVREVVGDVLSEAFGGALGPSADWVNATWPMPNGLYLFENDYEGYEVVQRTPGEEEDIIEEVESLRDLDALRRYVHALIHQLGGRPDDPLDLRERRKFEQLILDRYTADDLVEVSPQQARIALLFQETLGRMGAGKYVRAVPGEHVTGPTKKHGKLMVIFEGASELADEVMFSAAWREAEEPRGAGLESYNAWSATVYLL